MAVSAFGLLILAAAVLFYIPLVAKMGVPRLIIGLFFILLCLLAMILGLSLPSQLSNTLVRLGMNGVLVLAMLPGIQCGISLNLGLPIGIIGGLIGGLLCIEFGMSGFTGLFFAVAVGLVIAAVTGWLYGLLLNRLKGSEMSVTTYAGFSVVSLMCIAWLVLPFKSPIMKWPLGNGLRTTIGLQTSYRHVLNDFLSFEIFGITIPTGSAAVLCAVLPAGVAVHALQDRHCDERGGRESALRCGVSALTWIACASSARCSPRCWRPWAFSFMARATASCSSIRPRDRWASSPLPPSSSAARRHPAPRSATW